LPVRTADSRLDHKELASALILLVFHATHPDKPGFVEKGLGSASKFVFHFRRRYAAGRTSSLRRPAAELAPGKGAHCDAALASVLEAKVDVALATLDPFLEDQFRHIGENGPAYGLGLLARGHRNGARGFEVLLTGGLYDRWKLQFCEVDEVFLFANGHRTWYREPVSLGHLLETAFVQEFANAIVIRQTNVKGFRQALLTLRDRANLEVARHEKHWPLIETGP